MKSRTPLTVEVLRGNAVESQHQVMAVVCDERAVVSAFWGNIDFLTFPRSAIKPLQALALVESGAMEKWGLDEKMLAMACSSHSGEKHHLVVLKHWLEIKNR
jgi:L-asparaginase II